MPLDEYTLPIGKADVKRTGSDISVITYGLMVHHCLEAAVTAAQKGIDSEVVALRTLRPLDNEAIIQTAK